MADNGSSNWGSGAADNLNLPDNEATTAPTSTGDGNFTFLQWLQEVTGESRALDAILFGAGLTHDLATGGHKITGLPTPTATTEPVIKSQIDTDTALAANSDTRVASQKAVKAYADALIAAADAMVFKGVIDCSTNPNYPAADRGWTYRVSVAGKIGGASGTNVEAGDLLLCLTDGTASGTQAAVGAQWEIAQANIDGAVTGPASSTGSDFATFSGTSGKVIQDSGVSLDTGGTLAANSDTKVPSQKAVKTYVDAGVSLAVLKSLYDANTVLAATTDDTPAPLTVAASTFVGRKSSGNIAALTVADALATLGITPPGGWDKPTAALAQTIPRTNRMESQSCLISGTLYLQGIWLPGGITVTNISVASGGTPLSGGTNQWFALYDSSRGKLGVTSDDTSTAWAATTVKTLALGTPYVVPAAGGFFYIGVNVVGTVPSLFGSAANFVVGGLAPILAGSSTGSLTNPASAPSTAAAPVTTISMIYAYVS